MSSSPTRGAAIPRWPTTTALLREDGSGMLTVNDVTHSLAEATIDDARSVVLERVARFAREDLGRPVRLQTTDPDGQWELGVHPDGRVEEIDGCAHPARPVATAAQPEDQPGATSPPATPAPPPPHLAGSTSAGRTPASAQGPHDPKSPGQTNGRPSRLPRRPRTADDITSERMLRAQSEAPRRGWRRALYQLTKGGVNVGPSKAEVTERALIGRVKAPVEGCRRIAVVSRKGGTGKTTTTLMLGHTLATHRGDRVIALDGNPDAGTLGYRVRRDSPATIMDLLAHRDRIERYADIRAYTTQTPTRLEVVAADNDPRITQALVEQDFYTAVDLLERHYNIVCLDTGTGVLDSANKGILHLADQVIVVTEPALDAARAASATLDWFAKNGYEHLCGDGAIAVINAVQPRSEVDLDAIAEHFTDRCRAVVRVPWDRHLDAGGESDMARLQPATARAYLELTAAVADGFADRTPARRLP